MRSVKQTTTNCFSFHFKNFPSFLFFFLSFELKAGPREGRFLIAKETLEMFFGSNTFSLPVSATYVQRLGEVEGHDLLSRTFHGREANFVKINGKGLALSRHLWPIHGFVCFRSSDGGGAE